MDTVENQSLEAAACDVAKKCLEFDQLAPNWDSYGGRPIKLGTVAAAIAFLTRIVERFGRSLGGKAIPIHIAPLSSGGIQFEWSHAGNEIEIEIHPDGSFGYLQTFGAGDARQFHEADSVPEARALAALASVLEGEVMLTDKNNQPLVDGGIYSNAVNQFTCIEPHPANSEAF